jgi:hypothetical protein
MTYLAQVPADTSATDFDTKNASWFKIAEAGQVGGVGKIWVQADIGTWDLAGNCVVS